MLFVTILAHETVTVTVLIEAVIPLYEYETSTASLPKRSLSTSMAPVDELRVNQVASKAPSFVIENTSGQFVESDIGDAIDQKELGATI